MAKRSFRLFQGSRACFFSDLSTGESCPLRIPFDRLRAAVSPIPKSRKELLPPASHSRKTSFTSHTGMSNTNNNMLWLLGTIEYSLFSCTRALNAIYMIRLFC